MRVLVCGGRTYSDARVVGRALSAIHDERPITLVMQGGAKGADGIAHSWAEHRKIPTATYFANWRFVGRSAGPVRNQTMLDFGRPDLVVAFPGGRGTEDMVQRAVAAGIEVVRPVQATEAT